MMITSFFQEILLLYIFYLTKYSDIYHIIYRKQTAINTIVTRKILKLVVEKIISNNLEEHMSIMVF